MGFQIDFQICKPRATHVFLKVLVSSRNNDFLPRGHQIGRWYGLRSFIVLSLPTPHIIDSEDFMITILR